ncbi:M1 family metallopeptidase [Limosilactobacillus mucosae]|uniref:M1 family metallopeptidase n=1 Tax=Limosilactobacillus mucosae TaxID=97478 RepID=UPI0008888F96|nr:M1 family metallopeptidase [Limosilactobacillus mucosae]SDM93862.1 lysyl aminopeptidase. Metallo peptidase. MEROPS family M01 [Limosilactobacillus mucosae]SEK28117.1 lysyl aminopeptidase. Metallo peptidase. MEROPS family M01 [Limosilactobacillus mucosae]SFJ79384.1 lysyl aminopeptidase. Metallo peptidase. MEROPS family M01 [Limosilactobacillus mucosae]
MADSTRFYEKFQPDHYDIYLDIDRAAKNFKGVTTIKGNAVDSKIALHQKFLDVTSVQADGQAVPFSFSDRQEAIKIELPHPGDVELKVVYDAKLTDTMMGIYPSYYTVAGQKKQLVGTQFETTAARQAFPGIDEPEAKATFSLAIKYDEHPGETIIANMPEDHVENGVHYFKETVKMSTYLVAFAFGELQSKFAKTKSGVEIGVFSTKAHQPKELDFSLDIATRAIEFYEDFYQTPYPLPQSYQLALPDFSAGAMENWGLVTYREAYMLLDPDNTTLNQKRVIATVITHELAHQWFGDLVTMKWWDDLWLNESFANMMEYVAVDALEPEWKIWEMFQTSEVPMALQRDATDGVQSVHVAVDDPAEIDTLFDGAIVYAKGARMLVMVRALLGDEAMRKGLKNYFAAHQYGNATGADLWQALGEASGMNVGQIMESWLEHPGYPVVEAKIEDGKLRLSQRQFFIGDGEDKGRLWQIPLNTNYDQAPAIFSEQSMILGNYAELRRKNGQPFRINIGDNSHVIVKYDEPLLDDILDHFDELGAIDQLQLLQDLRLLAEGRQISYAQIVPLLNRFKDSRSGIVNEMLYHVANSLKNFVQPAAKTERQLQQLYDQLSVKQVQRLGWLSQKGETNDDQLTRPIVLSAALYAQNSDAIKQAHTMFEQYQDRLTELPADVRGLVLASEVKNYGSQELFDTLLTNYQQTSDAGFKQDICAALTKTQDAQLIAQLIDRFEDADTIKPQDLRAWFRGVLANDQGQQAAWDWIQQEWSWLEKTVGGDMEFPTYITVISRIFKSSKRLAEFKRFFEPKENDPMLKREIQMDEKVIASRVELVESEQAAVNAAIAKAIVE